jgi:hypothetical protein
MKTNYIENLSLIQHEGILVLQGTRADAVARTHARSGNHSS